MSFILWGILAIAVVMAGFAVLTWFRTPKLPPLEPGTELPATPLQRLARWGLVLGLLPGIAIGVMLLRYGAQAIYDDDRLRSVFTALLLLIAAVFLIVVTRLKIWVSRVDGTLDERDRSILAAAPRLQSAGMLVTLAGWMVWLIERFHGAGAVPLVYLYLLFWSCWVVSLLMFPLGILLGYRRQ